MENVAIYMRLSKEDEYIKDESNSVTSQRLMMLNYLSGHEELKGNKILQFVDDGYSGTNLNRPGMQDMLEKIRSDLVKCVIVKDFSRFSRDHIDLGSYVEQIFPFMGVRFIAINDDYDSKETLGGISGLGDQFKMLIYDYYSKDLSEKVKTSMVALKMQGKFVGGYAPFGYSKDPANRSKLILDEKAAEIVRKIFHMALDEMSMYQISQILNEEGVVTPAVYMKQSVGRVDANMTKNLDQQWETGKVKRILDNEIYTGTMVSGKVKAVAVGSSKRVHIPEEEWIRVANTHEAIISAEVFDKVKELRPDGFFYGKSKYLPHVLSGKVYCGGCGRNMAHSYQGRPKFLCNSRFFGGKGETDMVGDFGSYGGREEIDCFVGPGGVDIDASGVDSNSACGCTDMIRDEDLEAIVIRAIEDVAKKAVSMIEVQRTVGKVVGEKRRGLEDEIKMLDVKIMELEQALMDKYEEYREEKILREDYLEQKVEIEKNVSNVREKIQLLEVHLVNGLELQMKDVTGLEVFGKYLKVEKLTKELVDVVVERVVVRRKRQGDEWKTVEVKLNA